MEKITKEPNRRNCACFVANGVVYTKLKTPPNKRQHGEDVTRRQTRSLNKMDSKKIYESTPLEILDLIRLNEKLDAVSSNAMITRQKRNAEDFIDVIAEIQRNLSALEDTFKNSTEHPSEKCFVATGGQVNCSSNVYDDVKSWKRSRHQIDLLIKVLKKKISDLKDIRKHLKEHKPVSIKEDYEDISSKEEEEKVINAVKKETHDEMGPLINMDWYTSTTEQAVVIGDPSTEAPTAVPSIKRKVSKRPGSVTTTQRTTTTSSPIEDTKIPIFYIGEDKEESPVKPNITTEGPTSQITDTDIQTESTSPASTVTERFTTTSTKPHRHSHGSNGNRSQHHGVHEHKKTSDSSSAPAECYCDLDNER